jgi:hypothetical protein
MGCAMNFQSRFSALITTAFIVAVAPFAYAGDMRVFPPVMEGTTTTCAPGGVRTPLTWDGETNVACAQDVTISGGKVGIGTSDPQYVLDIQAPFAPTGSGIRLYGDNFNGGVGMVIANNIAGGDSWSLVSEGGSSAPVGSFGIYDNGLPGERFVILNTNGYVGIGTAEPQSTLDVNGVINASGPIVTTQVATTGIPPIFPMAYFDEYDGSNGIYKGGPGYARIASVGSNPSTRGGFLLYSGSSDNSQTSIPYFTVPNGTGDYTGINIPVGGTPYYPLQVNGTVYATGGAGALSDRRHKTDIQPLDVDALDTVAKLKPVTFMWKTPVDDGMKGRQIGFIAQDVQPVLPDAVLTANDADKTLGLKYDSLIPVLTKAIQELKSGNDTEATQIKALTDRLNALEAAPR